MKNSQTYLLIYKKNFIENLLSKKRFSTKIKPNMQEESKINNPDFVNLNKLFNWAKKKGAIFDSFQINYLDQSNRYVTAKDSVLVKIIILLKI